MTLKGAVLSASCADLDCLVQPTMKIDTKIAAMIGLSIGYHFQVVTTVYGARVLYGLQNGWVQLSAPILVSLS